MTRSLPTKAKAAAAATSASPTKGGDLKRDRKNSGEKTESEEDLPQPFPKKPKNTAVKKQWSELYDRRIFGKLDSVEETLADQFMEVGGDMLNRSAVVEVVRTVRKGYYDNNYHNFEHAAHVVMNCAFMLKQILCPLSLVERLSILFSALIHDVEHLGVPNQTLIQASHPLAVKFNDQSVAENNSLTVGLAIFQQHNLLSLFSEEDQSTFRKNIIEIVLSTDVADTYKKKLAFLKLEDHTNEEAGLNTSTATGRLALLAILMRTCDVASSLQSIHTAEIWWRNFFLESSLAWGNSEETLREECKKFFTAQISYMEGHSLILVVKLQTTQMMKPEFTDILLQNYQSNLSNWRAHGMDLLDAWMALAVENKQQNNQQRH